MPGQVPNTIWLYRIVHVQNIEYLLIHGMFHKAHETADPGYINIGDSELIIKRNEYPVGINPPGGNLGRYVPFYFGPHSPMLLNIKTGYRGITRRKQADIVYILCNAKDIVAQCGDWCFTDGHAKTAITEFYSAMQFIGEVDWNIVKEKYFNNTDEDFDRMRRKQAEFLVKSHVPVSCITEIAVYNEEKRILVQEIVNRLGLSLTVRIKSQLYF